MAKLVLLCFSVYVFLLVLHVSLAQLQCEIGRIRPLLPFQRIESEAVVTDVWNASNDQLECVGAAAIRTTINPNGLVLPSYVNVPTLNYVVQGRGIIGVAISGCLETNQSIVQASKQFQGSTSQDERSKVELVKEGYIIAIPVGVVHWVYNNGSVPLVMMSVLHTSNNMNKGWPNFSTQPFASKDGIISLVECVIQGHLLYMKS